MPDNLRALQWSGGVLGFGLGGFLDGIILHQVLQWHHLVSSVVPMDTLEGLELNTLWDGVFHLATYAVTVVGLVMLWRVIQGKNAVHSPRAVISGVLTGAGVFHLFDSVVNHWLLNIHHICYGPNLVACDAGYFLIGEALLASGWWITRAMNGKTAR